MAMKVQRPAWAEINLDHLVNNVEIIRSKLKRETKIMAIVKSDGYGHGAAVIANHLIKHGVEQLGVVMIEEAIELRKAGIEAPILILGVTLAEQAEQVLRYQLTPMVCTLEFAQALNQLALSSKKKAKVHLRLDIGLGSVGIKVEDALPFVQAMLKMEGLELEGVFTHLASSYGADESLIRVDLKKFEHTVEELARKLGISFPIVHAASSPGILHYPESHYDLVRAGIILYGLPATDKDVDLGLQPVMQLKAKILYIKELDAGTTIGYGSKQLVKRKTRLATVPLGYGDGLFLYYLTDGEVLVHGKRAPVYGQVFMDHFLIDVTDFPEVQIGDEVVIFGRQGTEVVTATEMAVRAQIGRLNSDCVTLLSKRVPRVYVQESMSVPEVSQLVINV